MGRARDNQCHSLPQKQDGQCPEEQIHECGTPATVEAFDRYQRQYEAFLLTRIRTRFDQPLERTIQQTGCPKGYRWGTPTGLVVHVQSTRYGRGPS